jgi:glucosamine--fructose-6-phosphate aminotransferase (isomerizing)
MILLGCGTSLNAAQIGAKLFREFRCFQTVSCYDASEFTLDDIPAVGKTGFLVLSQSGETKDVHRCMETLRHGYPILAVVNVVGSLIARESVCGVYLNAGREVGVASTKSFTSQIVALTLIAVWFAQKRDVACDLRRHYISHARFERELEDFIARVHPQIKDLAVRCKDVEHMFILGRDKMKPVADEGALKIKEISYIHAESYAGGALKHGPFALLDERTVVILLAPRDAHFAQMINAAEEIRSRNARVIFVTNTPAPDHEHLFESVVYVPENPAFQTIFQIVPLQLLAYECAVARGVNPDLPKNLAKVVTVDG